MFVAHRLRSRAGRVAFLPILALALSAGPVSAAVVHTHESTHNVTTVEYFPDDICGPRGGWTTFVTSHHLEVTDLGDSVHVVFVEHGTYTTVFDDPSIPGYASQFTDANHFNVTRGGTVIASEEFHDFPGTIQIHEHIKFVEVNGDVQIDSDVLTVTGCP